MILMMLKLLITITINNIIITIIVIFKNMIQVVCDTCENLIEISIQFLPVYKKHINGSSKISISINKDPFW